MRGFRPKKRPPWSVKPSFLATGHRKEHPRCEACKGTLGCPRCFKKRMSWSSATFVPVKLLTLSQLYELECEYLCSLFPVPRTVRNRIGELEEKQRAEDMAKKAMERAKRRMPITPPRFDDPFFVEALLLRGKDALIDRLTEAHEYADLSTATWRKEMSRRARDIIAERHAAACGKPPRRMNHDDFEWWSDLAQKGHPVAVALVPIVCHAAFRHLCAGDPGWP